MIRSELKSFRTERRICADSIDKTADVHVSTAAVGRRFIFIYWIAEPGKYDRLGR